MSDGTRTAVDSRDETPHCHIRQLAFEDISLPQAESSNHKPFAAAFLFDALLT